MIPWVLETVGSELQLIDPDGSITASCLIAPDLADLLRHFQNGDQITYSEGT
jgi:hypothetical protein